MLSIPLARQNRHQGFHTVTHRPRAEFFLIHGTQVTHGEAGTVSKHLPAPGTVLVRLAHRHHVHRGFGCAVRDLVLCYYVLMKEWNRSWDINVEMACTY